MEHCDLVEQDNYSQKVDETQNVTDPGPPRELEFLDVYHEPNHKITYSIEHIQGANNGEFILTGENGTFALAQNQDIDTGNGESAEKIDTEEDVESNIIEEYNNTENPIISTKIHNIPRGSASIESQSSVVQIIPKGKMYKMKTDADPIQMEQTVVSTTDSVEDKTIAKTEVRRSAESLIDLAVQAVIEEGMSLQKAAVKYELSKTVLWRRVRLHPNYMKTARENPQIKLVHERLKTGESLKSISHDLDIPMSTLHRYKVRLSQQGRLPDFIVCKKRDPGTREELREKLAKAVYACIHQGVSQNHAANLFDIPKSTLWRHLQKRALKLEQDQNDSSDVKEEIILS
ncbi:uncharacterized protein LOC119672685 [Teleopsis dalmanni]|nr:uncharacterized protein LOC119672685 [Teleopsis dalmanni]